MANHNPTRPTITAQRVRELLDYDSMTGFFHWRVTNSIRAMAGSIAGYTDSKGYVTIRIDTILYRAGRLAWLHLYGCWPSGHVDHINHICSDNRIANLRNATPAENARNRKAGICKTATGVRGVRVHKPSGKYQARVGDRHIGLFATLGEAAGAVQKARAELYGAFAGE